MRRVFALLVLAACGGDEGPEGADDTSLTIVSPAPGAEITRSSLDRYGTLVAAVPFEVQTTGEVDKVIVRRGSATVADIVDGSGTATLEPLGEATLYAIALDANGDELAEAQVTVNVVDPELADCHAFLDMVGVEYTVAGATRGIEDPITAMMPINGVPFRTGTGTLRSSMMGDCALIKSLVLAAPYWRKRGVTEVMDFGVYNYRCKNNNGTPPNCATGLSEHSFGNAIDLAMFKTEDGTTYDVRTDWVIDPNDDTCTTATEPGKDTWMHEMICELKQANVWNIVLTPNYNAAHRDHFHVDLTADSDFIERTLGGDAHHDCGAHGAPLVENL